MMLGAVTAGAQGLGLPNLTQFNKSYAMSNYGQFQANGSNYMQLETIWIDLLKLPSLTTFGGFSVMAENAQIWCQRKR